MLEKKTYKNWKEICEAMGWKANGGKYKVSRVKELERSCRFHKEGNKIIIDEIYENKLEKIDLRKNGNNTIYRNKIQKLIIDMCSSDKNGIIHMSVSELMLRFNMINEDYLNDRDNIHEIGKYGEIPKKTLYDFYDSSFLNAKQNIIRTLNDLQQKGLIEYSEDFMLLFKNGERRITNEYEKNIILRAEDEVVNSMNEVNKIKIFSYRKWGIFKRNVYKKLEGKLDIKSYHKVISIYKGENFTSNILDDNERNKLKLEINNSMIKSSLNSAKKRYEKYIKDEDKNDIDLKYILNSEKLVEKYIGKKDIDNSQNDSRIKDLCLSVLNL